MGFIKSYAANIALFFAFAVAGIILGQVQIVKIALVVIYLAVLASEYVPELKAKVTFLSTALTIGGVKTTIKDMLQYLFIGALLATSAGILASLQSLVLAVIGGVMLFGLVLLVVYIHATRSIKK